MSNFLQQNKDMVDSMTSRATFARHQRSRTGKSSIVSMRVSTFEKLVMDTQVMGTSPPKNGTLQRPKKSFGSSPDIILHSDDHRGQMEACQVTKSSCNIETLEKILPTTEEDVGGFGSSFTERTLNPIYQVEMDLKHEDNTHECEWVAPTNSGDDQNSPTNNQEVPHKRDEFKTNKLHKFIPSTFKNMFISKKTTSTTPEHLDGQTSPTNSPKRKHTPTKSSPSSSPENSSPEELINQWLNTFLEKSASNEHTGSSLFNLIKETMPPSLSNSCDTTNNNWPTHLAHSLIQQGVINRGDYNAPRKTTFGLSKLVIANTSLEAEQRTFIIQQTISFAHNKTPENSTKQTSNTPNDSSPTRTKNYNAKPAAQSEISEKKQMLSRQNESVNSPGVATKDHSFDSARITNSTEDDQRELDLSFEEFLNNPSPRNNSAKTEESHLDNSPNDGVLQNTKTAVANTSTSNLGVGACQISGILSVLQSSSIVENKTESSPNTATTQAPVEEKPEGTPYEKKLMIGEKTLQQMKTILTSRSHRYGFLTALQFIEFGLRAGFDEEDFSSIMAVTYSTFTTTMQLIPQIQYVMETILKDEKLPRINDEESEDDEDRDEVTRGSLLDTDCKLTPEQKNEVIGRVAKFLKQFVLLSFSDFQFDKQMHESLYSFVAPLSGYILFDATNGNVIQDLVVELVERITLVISRAHEDQYTENVPPPKPLIKKIPTDPRKITLVDIDPVEIARQLTLFEFSSFEKLTAKELLGASWMKETKEWTAPNVTQVIWRSNQMTEWVSTYLCTIKNLKERKKALKHLILVASACLDMHNYNTLFEIAMALISQPIYRLKKTWEVLKEGDLAKIWKRIEDITSFQGSRRAYRNQVEKVIRESVDKKTPCLPYLGVSLTDLVFFDEGNKDRMEKGSTTCFNFTKRALMGNIVYKIIAVKKVAYNFEKVDLIEQFIWWQLNSNVVSEEERDKLSRECEN